MVMTVTQLPTPNEEGQLHPQAPPPLLPKPGKENIRLQKVLQKAAKKKNPPAASAQPKAFRSTLSPVSEAGPDLEHYERSPHPPPTPETPTFLGLSLPPRFFIKPAVHHVASPYPQHRSFTFTVTEQRSLSECLRRTPSPRPPSPSVKPVIPPLLLQQPPKIRPTAPSLVPAPSSQAHFPRPIPQIVEPVAPSNFTANLHTPVFDVTVQEVQVNVVQSLLPEPESLRASRAISECIQKAMARTKEDNIPSELGQTEAIQKSAPLMTSPQTITNNTASKNPQEALLTLAPQNKPSSESVSGPTTTNVQPNIIKAPENNTTVLTTKTTELLTPTQQDTKSTQHERVVEVDITTQKANTTEQVPVSPDLSASSRPSTKVEPLLKTVEKVKPPRTKLSGWSRLKKHLVVEPEVPQFPVPESEAMQGKEEAVEEDKKEGKAVEDNSPVNKTSKPKESRANKMWDALLYQMSSPREEEKQKEEKEKSSEGKEQSSKKDEKPSFFFRCRLPLLLYRPRFDARKLREAASRPLKKITTMFDLGRLNRKAPEEEAKDFNRTASGWQLK
ncbi:proline-rich protein 33 [Lissotriton helveticus]